MEEGDPFTKARPTKWGSNEPIPGEVVSRALSGQWRTGWARLEGDTDQG
jgi:hypothetical protein